MASGGRVWPANISAFVVAASFLAFSSIIAEISLYSRLIWSPSGEAFGCGFGGGFAASVAPGCPAVGACGGVAAFEPPHAKSDAANTIVRKRVILCMGGTSRSGRSTRVVRTPESYGRFPPPGKEEGSDFPSSAARRKLRSVR